MKTTIIQPKEITQCCDTGINTASFDYYSGIIVVKERGLRQSTNTNEGNFMVCCGDVMFTVQPTEYPELTRRIL